MLAFFKNAITQLSRFINRETKILRKDLMAGTRHSFHYVYFPRFGRAGIICDNLGTRWWYEQLRAPEGASLDISGDTTRRLPDGCLSRVPKSPLMRLRHVSLLRDTGICKKGGRSTAQVRLARELCQRSPSLGYDIACIVCVDEILLASTPKFSHDVSKYVDDKK